MCRRYCYKIENRLESEFQRDERWYWWGNYLVSKPPKNVNPHIHVVKPAIRFPGAAIFFEFKHYKPKKRFTSTKCFAFMEMDEIKPGPIVIELWVDWRVFLSKCFLGIPFCFFWDTQCVYCTFLNFRYKKPTDFKRKKLQLLTKKQLYLHLHQTLHKDS